jgi:hypothetical protein
MELHSLSKRFEILRVGIAWLIKTEIGIHHKHY